MPELPIVDGEGRLSPTAHIILVSLSIYPDDEESRVQLAADLLMRQQQETGDLSGLDFLLPILHLSPGANEVLRRAVKAQEGAQFASSVLHIMLCASQFHPDININASMAEWGVVEVSRRVGTVSRVISERTQWRQWSSYKDVSHLRLAIETVASRYPEIPSGLMLTVHLQEILDLMESIRIVAEERRFFKSNTLWRVPPSLPTERVPVPMEHLSDLLLEVLRSYRPVNSRQ